MLFFYHPKIAKIVHVTEDSQIHVLACKKIQGSMKLWLTLHTVRHGSILTYLIPSFASNAHNVWLCLCADNFNQFLFYQPIINIVYKFPSWMCMTCSFMFQSTLIFGKLSLSQPMDINIRPLIDDLEQLWDVSLRQNFQLHELYCGK